MVEIFKKIYKKFDKLEDIIRGRLSRYPILYALVGSIGIIMLWRGIWVIGDDLRLSGVESTIIGVLILLATGLFVSFFIGEQIIISGIKEEKKIDEKTEEEIMLDTASRHQMQKEIKGEIIKVKDELDEIKKDITDIKTDIEKK